MQASFSIMKPKSGDLAIEAGERGQDFVRQYQWKAVLQHKSNAPLQSKNLATAGQKPPAFRRRRPRYSNRD
jgi:hypothetical protein